MRFTITHQDLFLALTSVRCAVSKHSALPVLANVLITASESSVEFAAMSLDIYAEYTIQQECSSGATTCNFEDLFSLIKAFKGEKISFELSVEQKLQVISKSVTALLATIPAKEFPQLLREKRIGESWEMGDGATCTITDQRVQGARLSLAELAHAVKMVVPTVSRDPHRPVLTCVYTHVEKGVLTMVGASTFRIAMYELSLSGEQSWENPLLIPAQSLTKIVRSLPKQHGVEMMAVFPTIETRTRTGVESRVVLANRVTFTSGPLRIAIRLIEGTYPIFRPLIPQEEQSTQWTVNASALARALPQKGTDVLMFHISDHLDVAWNPTIVQRVEAEISGPPLSVPYYAEWLKALLACSPKGALSFTYTQKRKLVKIRIEDDPGFTGVLAPWSEGASVYD